MCRDEGAAGGTAEPIATVSMLENAHVTVEEGILIFDPAGGVSPPSRGLF
jgi:hypothetical protein